MTAHGRERAAIGLKGVHVSRAVQSNFARSTLADLGSKPPAHPPTTLAAICMDFGKSFSKPFKKLKDKLPGGRRKRDGRSGGEDDGKGKEVNVKGGEVSQKNSYLRSEVSVESAVGGGPSGEGSNVDGNKVAFVDVNPLTSIPLISHIGEPDGM